LALLNKKKSELGLLLGGEFTTKTITISDQKLAFRRSIAYSVDYERRLSNGNTALLLEVPFAAAPSRKVRTPQLNAITTLATLFVTPSLRVQFVSHALASPWLSGGFGYGLYEGSSVLRNGVPNREVHRSVATAQFGAESIFAPRSNCYSRLGPEARFGTTTPLNAASFRVPVQRIGQAIVVISGGLIVHS
jgi:hypothetical protein